MEKLTIIIPTYNGEKTIRETVQSIYRQTYQDFNIIVQDDNSTDNTLNVIQSFKDKRIKIYKNKRNVGVQKNAEIARRRVKEGIVFFICQDDILSIIAIEETMKAFQSSKDIGAIVRPFFWFEKDIKKPVRATSRISSTTNEIIHISDTFDRLKLFFDSVGQLSGLAYRVKYFNHPFHEDIFPGHAYPFSSILIHHPIVFLKEYTVAVRISSSQSRYISSIYNKSPIQSWVDMYTSVFKDRRFKRLREHFIKEFVAKNYLGLIQIKNYSTFKNLLREIKLLIRYQPKNVLMPHFWLIVLGCIFIPASILIPLNDWYKRTINAKFLPKIGFK